MKKLPTQVPTQATYTREFSKDPNPAQPSPTQPTQPSSLFSRTLFFFGYGAFLAFSTASGRWGTAQERGARGLTRFRANEVKTCIFMFFEHFRELARAELTQYLNAIFFSSFSTFQQHTEYDWP